VVALRGTAAEKSRAGRPAEAAAALERALRIEPTNPDLWARLAEVRLAQGQPRQAESLALKALGLSAPGDSVFGARCHRLIAKARRAQGDEVGARAAEVRARELEDR
jgi:cytochrome c-type biogenesis protein CcmH/NrfG